MIIAAVTSFSYLIWLKSTIESYISNFLGHLGNLECVSNWFQWIGHLLFSIWTPTFLLTTYLINHCFLKLKWKFLSNVPLCISLVKLLSSATGFIVLFVVVPVLQFSSVFPRLERRFLYSPFVFDHYPDEIWPLFYVILLNFLLWFFVVLLFISQGIKWQPFPAYVIE